MNYTVAGIILIVIGLGLLIVSFIPIPNVEYSPEYVPVKSPVYTTVRKTWLNEEFVVPPGDAKAYCGEFPSGTTLVIHINVVSGGNRDINFWVMDEDEWTRFTHDESFYYYTSPSRRRITEAEITWSPPADKRICFVYDNSFSLVTSKSIESKIEAIYETYTVTTTYTTAYKQEIKPYTLSYLSIPGIILFIIGVGLVIGGRMTKKKEYYNVSPPPSSDGVALTTHDN